MSREGSSILLVVHVTPSGARVVYDGRVEDLFAAVAECMYPAVEDDLSCWFAALEDVLASGWSLPPPVLEAIDRRAFGTTPWLDRLAAVPWGEVAEAGVFEIHLLRRAPYAWALWVCRGPGGVERRGGSEGARDGKGVRDAAALTSLPRTSLWCWTSLDSMKASAPRRGIDGERRLRWISAFHRFAAKREALRGPVAEREQEEAAEFATSGPAGMVLADLSVPRPS
jgi:hypothetical protein